MKSFLAAVGDWLLFSYPVIGELLANVLFRWYNLGESVTLLTCWRNSEMAEKTPAKLIRNNIRRVNN